MYKIKPLEWSHFYNEKLNYNSWTAMTPKGHYVVEKLADNPWYYLHFSDGKQTVTINKYATSELAAYFAEDHWMTSVETYLVKM
jgi:hypothetical protein